jgi:hypothetical protein
VIDGGHGGEDTAAMDQKKSTHRPGAPGRELTAWAEVPGLMAVGGKNGVHGLSPLPCYRIGSWWRSVGGGLGQFGHKNMRVFDLDRSRNAARHPVLHSLGSTSLINRNQLSNLGWASKASDQFCVC